MSVATLPAPQRSALPSGPCFRNPFRFFSRFQADPIGMLTEISGREGRLACMLRPPFQTYAISHPDHVRHVFLTNHKNYWKGVFATKMEPLLGKGLIVSDGDFWKRQRTLAAPAFYPARLATYAEGMTVDTKAMLDEWEAIAARGEAIDVARVMPKLTLDIVSRALFGLNLRSRAEDFYERTTSAIEYANYALNHLLIPPRWVPTARNRRVTRDLAYMNGIIAGLIADARANPPSEDNLLASMLAAIDDETHEGMTDVQLRDELFTFIGAGFETTALTLAWTFVTLSQHPEIRERLHAEVEEVLGGRTPTADDVERLTYTRCVIQEVLRLYPPAWAVSREAYEDDEIEGYRIPAKSIMMASPWVTHRLPEFWDDPETFDPDRFLPERSNGRHRFAWWPFGAGPRTCIGNHFAMMELQIVLAMVAQRFTLDLENDHPPIEPWPVFTLRMKPGARMRLTRRAA